MPQKGHCSSWKVFPWLILEVFEQALALVWQCGCTHEKWLVKRKCLVIKHERGAVVMLRCCGNIMMHECMEGTIGHDYAIIVGKMLGVLPANAML